MEETLVRMAAPTLAGIKTGSLFPYYYRSREELGKEMGRLNRLLIPRGLRLVLLRLTARPKAPTRKPARSSEKRWCEGTVMSNAAAWKMLKQKLLYVCLPAAAVIVLRALVL